ncbi:MAG: DUF445 domain-containing protein [Propionibacteriales bacterium]|nr:DUF445 domain-containing protein [Propionibacteriales bacterium]
MTVPISFGVTDSAADQARGKALRRMRGLALGLLLLAALVFIATQGEQGPWAYVHATAEAAMVGAIADWFAVSALFRHPLGIPIPHTAIIPTRKLALGKSLEEFVTENFLSEAVVRDRIADAEVSRRLGTWLREEANASRVVDEVAALARGGLQRITDDDVASLLAGEIIPRLLQEPLSATSGRLLEDVVEEKAHHGIVDLALSEAHQWLGSNEEAVTRILNTRAPWWTPQWLDELVTQRIYLEVVAWVEDISNDPHHGARRALDDMLRQVARDLQNDPQTMERAERLKTRILSQPQVVVTATAVWNVVRRSLVVSLDDPASQLRARGLAELSRLGDKMVSDASMRERVDRYASDAAAFIVSRYGAELASVITSTIDRWDGKEAARRIELHVGRDLQFIRINGTIVGGLAGLVIYTLARVL